MFTRHNHSSENLTAAWLLPGTSLPLSFSLTIILVVPPITIAAVGSSLATLLIARSTPPTLPDLHYALAVLIVSYLMLGVGLLLACGLMVIYFQRLAIHHLPGREVIVSTFLPFVPLSLFCPLLLMRGVDWDRVDKELSP